MRFQRLFLSIVMFALVVTALAVSAQDTVPTLSPDAGGACGVALQQLWTAGSDACVGAPQGFVCNGGSVPLVEPAGAVANALAPLGALVESPLVDAIQTPGNTPETGAIGLVWLRTAAPLRITAIMLGAASLRDISPPDFTPWQSMLVLTAPETPSCAAAPQNAVILQTPLDVPALVAINGATINLNGTVLVRGGLEQSSFVGLSGFSTVLAFGQQQQLFPGQQVFIRHSGGDYSRPSEPPLPALPFEPSITRNLPVPLFERPFVMPQPGIVTTQGDVNLRSAPTTDAGVIVQVPAGVTMTVLGMNSGRDWYHVRLPSGETGWLRADLVRAEVGMIEFVYEATPSLPQRYGELGRTGRIVAPTGAALRVGPDATFPALTSLENGAVVSLVARSPYSPWLKVDTGGAMGWVALLAIETRAFIEALPIDFSAPPPPTPTTIPGSFGNAFPDPNNP
jgi:uncharacterized protein YraI